MGKKYEPLISLYTIVSPSMEPNIRVYDVIITKKANTKIGHGAKINPTQLLILTLSKILNNAKAQPPKQARTIQIQTITKLR